MSRWLVFAGLPFLIGLAWVNAQKSGDESSVESAVASSADATSAEIPAAQPIVGQHKATPGQIDPVATDVDEYVKPPSTQLRKKLSRMQYNVTQNEATEPARKNRYWNHKKEGVYECVVCGQDLFSSETKFKSGTGWPSFYSPIDEKQVATKKDYFMFYPRVEVHCSRCEAHLGHVFDDGPQPTGKRFCMNSASLNFVEKKGREKRGDEKKESGKEKSSD